METSQNHQQKHLASRFLSALTRKKPLDTRTQTNLYRCLNLMDLTALGVGSTLGLGLYVMVGTVASCKAGPGVLISFLLAAIASALSALCYAEFAGRIPRAGSAYVYSYITSGEFVAFIIGWNLLLEYVIGAAATTRGLSTYIRFLVNQSLKDRDPSKTSELIGTNFTAKLVASTTTSLISDIGRLQCRAEVQIGSQLEALNWETFLSYFRNNLDWLSVVLVLGIMMLILFGAKDSTNVTMLFTLLNLGVVAVIIIAGWNSISLHNWQLEPHEVPLGFGSGGFLPYGWSGVVSGSATCFFGFIGFDTIASSAEEAKNPRRNLPISILLSLFISFCAYISIAAVQTLIWPYYDQSRETVLPYIFQQLDLTTAHWLVLLGGLFGLASTELGGMFPLPRIIYSMSNDRLIFGFLSKIDPKMRLPVRATYVGCSLVGLMAALLNVDELADMVSIGTLAAYTLVSLSVLILRYEDANVLVIRDQPQDPLNFTGLYDEICTAPGSIAMNNEKPVALGFGSSIISDGNRSSQNSFASETTQEVRPFAVDLRRTRMVKPQLSVGFQSWFCSQDEVKGCKPIELNDCLAAEQAISRQRMEPSWLDVIQLWKTRRQGQEPGPNSSRKSKSIIMVILILAIVLSSLLYLLVMTQSSGGNSLDGNLVALIRGNLSLKKYNFLPVSIAILLVALILLGWMLARFPVNESIDEEAFRVPLVPLIPMLSIIVNSFLMISLNSLTWVRFGIWMGVGFLIYFSYGIRKSRGYLTSD